MIICLFDLIVCYTVYYLNKGDYIIVNGKWLKALWILPEFTTILGKTIKKVAFKDKDFNAFTIQLQLITWSWASLIALFVKNPPAMQETEFDSWVGKICWGRDRLPTPVFLGFPCGSAGKESACNVGDLALIPGLGRSPGEGKGYPLQHSVLENSVDGIVRGVTKSWTWLNNFHFTRYL